MSLSHLSLCHLHVYLNCSDGCLIWLSINIESIIIRSNWNRSETRRQSYKINLIFQKNEKILLKINFKICSVFKIHFYTFRLILVNTDSRYWMKYLLTRHSEQLETISGYFLLLMLTGEFVTFDYKKKVLERLDIPGIIDFITFCIIFVPWNLTAKFNCLILRHLLLVTIQIQ